MRSIKPAFLLLGEEAEHAGAGLAAAWLIVVFQLGLVAAIRDGVEIEVEDFGFGKQLRRELADPTAQEFFLVASLGAIRISGRERFLGQDVEAGEESEGFVEIEIVDVTAAFLVEEFEDEQTEHGVGSGNHARARIACIAHQAIQAELGEQRQEQEEPGNARADGARSIQREQSAVGDRWLIGTRVRWFARGSPVWDRSEKGGVRPWRMQARNCATRLRSVPYAKSKRAAATGKGCPSMITARIAS